MPGRMGFGKGGMLCARRSHGIGCIPPLSGVGAVAPIKRDPGLLVSHPFPNLGAGWDGSNPGSKGKAHLCPHGCAVTLPFPAGTPPYPPPSIGIEIPTPASIRVGKVWKPPGTDPPESTGNEPHSLHPGVLVGQEPRCSAGIPLSHGICCLGPWGGLAWFGSHHTRAQHMEMGTAFISQEPEPDLSLFSLYPPSFPMEIHFRKEKGMCGGDGAGINPPPFRL